jgi:hypothetical protein
MQQHSSDSFRFLSLSLRLFSISFLDNNVHLIRSRDHHTDIGSSRTGSLLLLAAPVPLHRGHPPLFRLSLILIFLLSFPSWVFVWNLASEHWLFVLIFVLLSGGAFLNSNLCDYFRFLLSPTIWRWAWERVLGKVWLRGRRIGVASDGEIWRLSDFCAVFFFLKERFGRATATDHTTSLRHFLLSSVLR